MNGYDYFFNNTLVDTMPNEDSLILIGGVNTILLKNESIPTYKDLILDKKITSKTRFIYLLTYLNKSVYAAINLDDLIEYTEYTLRKILEKLNDEDSSLLLASHHLKKWYEENVYCGKCANKQVYSKNERALICPKCNKTIYPRINPVIIVGIKNGSKLLLTKYAHGEYYNYALIAGFVEVGESLEHAIAREILEEVGLKVKNIQYFSSQPWGMSQSVIAGFTADLDGDDHVTMQESELKEAIWCDRRNLPENTNYTSVTWQIIDHLRLT